MKNFKKKSILCVILARGGSKGIPKKNIFILNNHPLIGYTIEAAKKSKFIEKIIVSTDDLKIAKIARKYGAETPFLRPKSLATDKIPSADALRHAVKETEKVFKKKYDYVIELPCVAPLRDHLDTDKAIKILIKKNCDSVISYVNTGEKHPIRLKRIIKNKVESFCKEYPEPSWGSRRQDFEPSYIRNGAIYAMTRECILHKKSRWGKKSYPMIMEDTKSINIDTKHDLLIAKLMIDNGLSNNNPKQINQIEKIKTNKKKKILITTTTTFLENFKKDLTKKFNCIFAEGIGVKKLQKILPDIDAWVCSPCPTYKIDKECLKNAKKLKAIFTPSTGSTHIDLKCIKNKKVELFTIKNNAKLNKIKASSEFTFGLLLSAFRNLIQGTKIVNGGRWRDQEKYIRGNQIYKKKLGIIGFGRIGENLYNYSKAFGMQIKAFDPMKKVKLKKLNIYSNLNNMLKISDVIAICVHLNKKTKLMADDTFFKKMKKNSIFINTSRGEVVNEIALMRALKSKKIKFAALDVIQNEQNFNSSSNKLIQFSKNNNNLIITPHMAGLTYESEIIAANIIFEKLIKFFKKNKF